MKLSRAEEHARQAQDLGAFSGFSLTHARGQIAEALSHFGRARIFGEYTKHDMSHVEGMLDLYDKLIPGPTIAEMSTSDWLLLVLSTYLHDFGLLVTEDEYQSRSSTSFDEFVATQASAADREGRDYFAKAGALDQDGRDRFFYEEFVRTNHAARVRAWITADRSHRLGGDPRVIEILNASLATLDKTFRKDLALVCESHHRDDLANTTIYPVRKPYGRTDGENANIQYSAILLRAADLLHITEDRAPSVAMKTINPSNPISQAEWAKQNAVKNVRPQVARNRNGDLDPLVPQDTIEVFASFEDDTGYFGLTRYLRYAEDELRQCHEWAMSSQKHLGVPHAFPWTFIDTTNVLAEGFIANRFEFKLDQYKILDLLTGHTLYNDSNVVLRELLQNSIDAARLQRELDECCTYSPTVRVRVLDDQNVVEVIDNGTGMSQEIIEQNFLRVGSSRYQGSDFRKAFPDFTPISRFGIGVLSTFMIADRVHVTTLYAGESEARELTLESVHGDYLVRLYPSDSSEVPAEIRPHGTCVRLALRPSAQLEDIQAIIKHWIVVPNCDVYLEDGDAAIEIGGSNVAEALESHLESLQLKLWTSDEVPQSGAKRVFHRCEDGFEIAYLAEWDAFNSEWAIAQTIEEREFTTRGDVANRDPRGAANGVCIEGIRVTTASPGFETPNGAIAIVNATGKAAPRTNVARTDLERTPEYSTLFKRIYGAYTKHVSAEVDALCRLRNSSPTRAAREVPFIYGPVFSTRSSSRIASHDELYRCIYEAPFYVIERGEQQMMASLAELHTEEVLATIESPVTRYLGYFLEQIPTGASIRELVSAVGYSEFPFPDAPLIAEQVAGDNLLGFVLRNYWTPTRIETYREPPATVAYWRQVDHPVWIPSYPISGYGVSVPLLQAFSDVDHRLSSTYYAPIRSAVEMQVDPSVEVVKMGQRRYLSSYHPFFDAEVIDNSLTDVDLAWFAARLASLIAALKNSRGRRRVSRDEEVSDVMQILLRAGLLRFFNESSIERCLRRCKGSELDMMMFDRRSKGKTSDQ